MSKAFKLIIVLILTTYHVSFVFCQFYGEPKITYRPRKSGTNARSFKINLSRKTFDVRDRKAFGISNIYSDKFLKEIESQMQSKTRGAQQWQAPVETQPRKKNVFPESDQKSRQEKNVDMYVWSESEELNVSEGPTKTQKNSQKRTQQSKEKLRKEKQNKKDRKKNKESLSIQSQEQIKSKELKSEQIRNDHLPKSSQPAVVQKSNLRGGNHHHSGLVSRQRDHENNKHNNHCVKKCYIPKCEVECSANKCKALTRGPDSAAVCKGDKCQGECSRNECIAACEGDSCSVKCKGSLCHAVAEGRQANSTCVGEFCVAFSKGHASKPKCEGKECQTWCVGDNCVAKCHGFECEAMCIGRHCKTECVGKNCTKFHYIGKVPEPDKPWVLDSKSEDSKSEEISISDESGYKSYLANKLNKDDADDGYYGNKAIVKNTIYDKVINNEGNFVNSGNSVNKYTYDNKDNVTIDYDIVVQIGKRLGDYIKEKIAQFKDASLMRHLPSFI